MDYIVAWSGSAARNGTAEIKSLSGYLGRSSLFVPETRAPKDTAPARLHEDERYRRAQGNYYKQTRRTVSAREKEQLRKAAQQRYSQTVQGKTARANAKRTWQARTAAQQDLFGTA